MSSRKSSMVGLYGMLAIFTLLALTACTGDSKPVKGFVLPQGDIAQGEQVFIDFNCHGCHTIPDKEFPATDFQPPFILEIGGEVYRVKNYGELLTAIVNPDHIISLKYRAMVEKADRETMISPMPYYGEHMTVAELIDLVEFLHAQYTKLQPQYYRGYYLTK
ncbi:MAG TPA: cytochrome c [Xanthomonadales bacterium]|nr:cytochrome c [Xanthomonadales bacterium]